MNTEVCFVSRFVAETLKALRQKQGLSQQELAKKADLDRTYISMLERGQRNLTMGTMETLMPLLGVSTAEFLLMVTETIAKGCQNTIDSGQCQNTDPIGKPCPTNRDPQKVMRQIVSTKKSLGTL